MKRFLVRLFLSGAILLCGCDSSYSGSRRDTSHSEKHKEDREDFESDDNYDNDFGEGIRSVPGFGQEFESESQTAPEPEVTKNSCVICKGNGVCTHCNGNKDCESCGGSGMRY